MAQTVRHKGRSPTRIRRLGLALIGAGLLLILLWLGIKAVRAYQAASQALAHLEVLRETLDQPPQDLTDQLEALEDQVGALNQEIVSLRRETRFLNPILSRLSWVPRYGPELAATPHLTALAVDLSGAGVDLMEIASTLLPVLEEEGEDSLIRAIVALQEQQDTLEQLQARLLHARYERTFIDPALLNDGPYAQVGPLLEELDAPLSTAEGALGMLNAILPQAGTLLGMGEPQRYLLLGQSNYELRATGGFVGSMGPVTVHQGRIVDLDYRRSPEWDNPEREKVQPPLAFERYMRFGAWFIRDANFYADFPTSARNFEWFWELDGHDPVEGVIAVDLYAVENILEAIGTLEVPEYGISVGGTDVLERIWEGHRQDKDRFLSALVAAAAARLQQPDVLTPESLLALLEAIGRSLEEKHLLLYFNDPSLQEAVVQAGWGGAIRDDPGDFFMVADSDFSWAEVNRFIEEEIHYRVTLDRDLQVQESTIILTYWNHFDRWRSGGTNEPFGGACFNPETEDIEYAPGCYGDYIQLLIPWGSRFLSAEGFDDGMEYRQEAGRTVIAGYVRVFPGEQRSVSVSYVPPVGPLGQEYRLTVQKQPGTDARPLEIEVVVDAPDPVTVALRTDLRVDREITASWQGEHLLLYGGSDSLRQQDPAQRAHQQAFAEGLSHWQAGRRDEALDHWQEDGVPDLVLDQANLLLSRGDLAEAEALCRAALELIPDSSRAHFLLGKVLLGRGDVAGATQALETSVSLDPENRSARLELGLLYEAQGNPEQAGLHLPYADHKEASHILWQRAWEHLNRGADQAGLDALRLILLLDPNDTNAHIVLADQLRRLQRYDEALAAYEDLHRAAPGDVRYYIGRAQLFAQQGQGDAAIAELEAAVALAPGNGEAWFHLGRFRWQFLEDAAGATAALEQAVALYPSAWYATTLGGVYREAGDLEAAVTAYEQAVTLPGRDASTWSALAQAYLDLESWEQAIEAYTEAVRLAPNNAALHANLAGAYEMAGQIEQAIAAYEAALALQPDNETWQRALERLRD